MAARTLAEHPLVRCIVSKLRDKETRSEEFRRRLGLLAGLLCYEACSGLRTEVGVEREGGNGRYREETLGDRVALVPILRAGTSMLEACSSLLPDAPVLHLGIFRDKVRSAI